MDIVPQSAIAERLETLTRTSGSSPSDESMFDCCMRIAAQVAGVQLAVISLHTGYRHWVRSEFGPGLRKAVQASLLHEMAQELDVPLVVPDAAEDPRFRNDVLVTGAWQARFFASLPLRLHSGRRLGQLCLIDPSAQTLTETQLVILQDVARTVIDQIEQRLQSTTDALTGVYTRRYMACYLEPEVARCRRHGNQLSAMALDLDQLKALNDRLGHAAGDIWIQAVVSTLRAALRFSDLVARVGGGAFLVLLPETPAEGAALVAERVHGQIATLKLPFAEQVMTGTASIGVTSLARHEHVGDLLRRLDRALDGAKLGGQNRVVFEAAPEKVLSHHSA